MKKRQKLKSKSPCFAAQQYFKTLKRFLTIIYQMAGIDSFFFDPQEELQNFQTPWLSCTMPPTSKQANFDESVPLQEALKFPNDVELQQYAFSGQHLLEIGEEPPETDSGGGEKRDNNTIFKTPLSEFRKSIIDVVKGTPCLQFIRKEIQAVCVTKNQSVFPKWLSIVRALQIQNEVHFHWNERKEKLKQKKTDFLKDGKYTYKRLCELQKTIKMMDDSLRQSNFQKSFDIYWGNYKQHQKYERCKRQVKSFDDGFRKQFAFKVERSLRSKAGQAQRGCKRLKTRKIQKTRQMKTKK